MLVAHSSLCGFADGLRRRFRGFQSPVDLSQWMTAVKDQEEFVSPCNCCTAYAVAATIEGTHNRNRYPDRIELNSFRLFQDGGPSEQCGTSHWWPRDALQYCRDSGIYKLSQPGGPPYQIGGYQQLIKYTDNPQQKQTNIKDWMTGANTGAPPGPVVAVMVQFADFYEFGNSQSSGTENQTPYVPRREASNHIVGGHVVSIAGFDDNPSGSLPAYWLCKNSWGPDWNGTGYVRIAQSKNNRKTCYIDIIDAWGVRLR